MSFRAYGKWCGPGWSAGQWKDAKDLTEKDKQVPADDALDQACKEHDIAIAEGDPNANEKFVEKTAGKGLLSTAMAAAVYAGGPSSQSILRNKKEMPVQKRESKKRKEHKIQYRKEHPKRVFAENEDDDLETGLAFVGGIQDAIELSKEDEAMDIATADQEVVESLIDANGDFITPQRATPIMAPSLTREDRPLRGPREVGSLTNLIRQAEAMQDTTMEAAPMAMSLAISDGSGSNQRGNRETTVKYNMRAEMGIFTETRTAYLPITFFFSVNNVRRTAPIPLRIRLDWPYNILKGNTLTRQEIIWNGGSYTRARGLSNDAVQSNERANGDNTGTLNSVDPGINKDQLTPFPCTIVGDTAKNDSTTTGNRYSSSGTISDSACIPAYRKWYANLYDFAHCMETDYRITYFSGDQNESFENMIVYEGMNCTSDNNTARIPEDADLQKVMHWPYLKEHRINGRTSEKPRREYVISGTWTDNAQFPMKMVPNEEDQKTWTSMSSTDFTDRALNYREELLLLHYSDYDSTHTPAYYNIRVDLRYKVQFRDLSQYARFLGTGTKTCSTTDCVQVPNFVEIIKATTVTSEL